MIFFALRKIPNVEPEVMTCYAVFDPTWLQNGYVVYTWLMQFLIPLCIIIGCYASISLKVFNSIKRKSTSKSTSSKLAKAESDMDLENSKKLLSFENDYASNESSRCNTIKIETKASSMFSKLSNASRTVSSNQISFRQHCQKNFSNSKIKTIKLTLTVIVLYIICCTPYFIGMIMNLMLKPEHYANKIISKEFFFIFF